MTISSQKVSPVCRRRLHVQGYDKFSDQELYDFRYGIRFAYTLCITTVALGLIFTSIPVLSFAALIALAGAFPPYHPFDYLYNYGVRHILGKPKMPPRTSQGRFACGIASVWLLATIYLLYSEYAVMGNVLGITLFAVGALVSFTDICIPSMIYNPFFKKETNDKLTRGTN